MEVSFPAASVMAAADSELALEAESSQPGLADSEKLGFGRLGLSGCRTSVGDSSLLTGPGFPAHFSF